MRAVILAAGSGVRLGASEHKALLEVAPGLSLLGNQLRLLAPLLPVEAVTIVVGSRQADVRRAAPGRRFVENPRFDFTNTAASLLLALEAGPDDDVIVLNGDLFLTEEALRRLMRAGGTSRSLVVRGPVDHEVVGFRAGDDGAIEAIGKGLAGTEGEAIGAHVFLRQDAAALRAALRSVSETDFYEAAMQSLLAAGRLRLAAVDASGLGCQEVDFPADLAMLRRRLARRSAGSAGSRGAEFRAGWRPKSVGLYGVGHFGHALLTHLDAKSKGGAKSPPIKAFDRDEAVRAALRTDRKHPYQPQGEPLSEGVTIVDSAPELLEGIDTLVLAVMSSATREVADLIGAARWSGPLVVVNTAKALDASTGRRLSEVFCERIAQPPFPLEYAALSGGTIAEHLMRREPLGMTVACENAALLPGLRGLFSSESMWVEATTDLAGVELAGALKNIISICAGMVGGMGRSLGTETHLISRMASEVEEFCVGSLGADRRTFSLGSQCWGSDLWMSCSGPTRNRSFGEMLGRGATLEDATAAFAAQRKTVEGVQTLRAIEPMMRGRLHELPLLTAAARIILGSEPPETLLAALMRLDDGSLEPA